MLFDPSSTHYYQPSYTMIGGGVLGNVEETKRKENTYVKRSMKDLTLKGINLKQEAITKIDAEH